MRRKNFTHMNCSTASRYSRFTHLEYWPNSFVLRIPRKVPFQLQRFRQAADNSNVCDEFNRKLLTNSVDLHWQNTDTWLNTNNWENTYTCLNMIFQPPFLLASPYKNIHRVFWWNYISLSWKSKRKRDAEKATFTCDYWRIQRAEQWLFKKVLFLK